MGDNPILSQYFANDPPSFFDEIAARAEEHSSIETSNDSLSIGNISNNVISTNFLSTLFHTNSEIPICGSVVPEDVRDLWEPPHIEPGIPALATMPGVMSANDLTDPVREAVIELLGESEASLRKLPTSDDVTQDERGLRCLIESGCYRAAVNLTGKLLTMYGQGYGRIGQPAKHTPFSLQLWFTRFALLIKLKLFDLCQSETEAFGLINRPDIYYEFYPEMYSGRNGSMASFSFRLLLAEFPLYTGAFKIAIDRLTDLVSVCNQIISFYKNMNNITAMNFWQKRETRVYHSIINCAILMKDFALADHIMTMLLEKDDLNWQDKRSLYSTWGRIYLQCGDIVGAEKKFGESRKMREDPNSDVREFIDKGLVAVAQNDFQEAFGFFQKAFTLNSQNIMLYNNMGVCLLYSGKLKDAIALYEKAIVSLPQKALNESLLLNLSTLYELESNNYRAKKIELLKQINKSKADLNMSLDICLKLQPVK